MRPETVHSEIAGTLMKRKGRSDEKTYRMKNRKVSGKISGNSQLVCNADSCTA
jgi:hypothetical protein